MIDDFDTINIYNDLLIPADIVWLISATNNHIISKYNHYSSNCLSISSLNHRIMDAIKWNFCP